MAVIFKIPQFSVFTTAPIWIRIYQLLDEKEKIYDIHAII